MHVHILVFSLPIYVLPSPNSEKTGSKYPLCTYLINLQMQKFSHLHCYPILHIFPPSAFLDSDILWPCKDAHLILLQVQLLVWSHLPTWRLWLPAAGWWLHRVEPSPCRSTTGATWQAAPLCGPRPPPDCALIPRSLTPCVNALFTMLLALTIPHQVLCQKYALSAHWTARRPVCL